MSQFKLKIAKKCKSQEKKSYLVMMISDLYILRLHQ